MDKRLGKGLKALISTYSSEEPERYIDNSVPIDSIIPNRNQPRQTFSEDEMKDLISSIKENGILQPLTVHDKGDGKFELIAGERRLRAAKSAGLKTVPVYIISVETDVEMLEYALVENIQREDLNPLEESEGYAILSGKYDLTQEEISKKIGKSRSDIANTMRLLKLPPKIKNGLRTGKISRGHARAILSLRKSKQMENIYERILKGNLSVRQTEVLASQFADLSKVQPRGKSKSQKSKSLISLEGRIRDIFKTKVSIQRSKKGKGKILIEFYSDDELERIIELLGKLED